MNIRKQICELIEKLVKKYEEERQKLIEKYEEEKQNLIKSTDKAILSLNNMYVTKEFNEIVKK